MSKPLIWEVNKFSLPLIFSQVITLMIGQKAFSIAVKLGTENLISMNTIDNFIYSLSGILGVISVAFSMSSSKAIGEKKTVKFNQLVSSVMFLNILVGLLCALLIIGCAKFLVASVYRFSGATLHAAVIYLYSMSFYVLLTLVTFTLTNLLKIIKKTHYIFWISIASSLLQVLLSSMFIKGTAFFPPLGILGAGLALNIALVFTIFCYGLIVRKKLVACLRQKPIYIKLICQKSIPLALQELFEGIIFLLFLDAMIARLDTISLGIYSILNQALVYLKMPMYMYGNALTIFGSEAYGARNKNQLIEVRKVTLFLSVGMYLLLAIVLYRLRAFFIPVFTAEKQLIAAAATAMLPLFLLSLPAVIYELNKNVLQVLDKSKSVVMWTCCLNLFTMAVVLIVYNVHFLTLKRLFLLYAINYIVLAIIFNFKFKKVLTEINEKEVEPKVV
jgi:Na+-driven multidrug efflux pump